MINSRDLGSQWIEEENICSNVIQAIEAEDEVKKARIEKLFPPKWQKLFGEFAGVVGSKFYTKLKSGTKVYHRFVLRKARLGTFQVSFFNYLFFRTRLNENRSDEYRFYFIE